MLHRATLRRIPQLSVDSVGIVVIDVFSKKTPQVLFIEYDYVIEQFSADAADPSFCDPILPRASKGRSQRLDSDLVDHFSDPV